MSTGAIHDGNIISGLAKVANMNQYLPVKRDSADNTYDIAAAVTDQVVGFITPQGSQANAGGPVGIQTSGRTLALAGSGGWTRGAKLTCSTAGVLIATTTAGDLVCAIAEQAAAEGEYGEVTMNIPCTDYGSLV